MRSSPPDRRAGRAVAGGVVRLDGDRRSSCRRKPGDGVRGARGRAGVVPVAVDAVAGDAVGVGRRLPLDRDRGLVRAGRAERPVGAVGAVVSGQLAVVSRTLAAAERLPLASKARTPIVYIVPHWSDVTAYCVEAVEPAALPPGGRRSRRRRRCRWRRLHATVMLAAVTSDLRDRRRRAGSHGVGAGGRWREDRGAGRAIAREVVGLDADLVAPAAGQARDDVAEGRR